MLEARLISLLPLIIHTKIILFIKYEIINELCTPWFIVNMFYLNINESSLFKNTLFYKGFQF